MEYIFLCIRVRSVHTYVITRTVYFDGICNTTLLLWITIVVGNIFFVRLVFHPEAHLFFLSSSRLVEVMEAAKMNKDMTKVGRRWYANGLLEDETVLKAIENLPEVAMKTSLTTLSFMASEVRYWPFKGYQGTLESLGTD